MGDHPINLTVAFLLELAGLYAFGFWGWYVGNGFWGVVLAIVLPLLAATVWGVFGVKGEKYRGAPVVAVSGKVRLVIEVAFFILACWALFAGGAPVAGAVFGIIAVLQHLASYERMVWLFQH